MYREKIISDLQKMIDTNIPIIYINDFDTVRIDSVIYDSLPNTTIEEWNPGLGNTIFGSLMTETDTRVEEKEDELYRKLLEIVQYDELGEYYLILREIQDFIELAPIKSLLSTIAQRKIYDRDFDATIILVSSIVKVPDELQPYVSFLDFGLPDDAEIDRLIFKHIEVNKYTPETDFEKNELPKLRLALKGMTPFVVDRMLDVAMNQNGTLNAQDHALIMSQKKQLVKKSGVLEYIEQKNKLRDIGGLNHLKNYLSDKALVRKYMADAIRCGISVPKGIFLVGMPGCGKSLCAEATSACFGEPLLKMDMGNLMDKYVGNSEEKLRKAIKTAEAVAPCVLWIDEIEKGFSGIGGQSDVVTRMFGTFLTWMQNKESAVYVVATANNINGLPPELKRKGRFDEIFFVDLPNDSERKDIFNVHLEKKRQALRINQDCKDIIESTDGFNGADIEYVVNKSIEELFVEGAKRIDKDKVETIKNKKEHKIIETSEITITKKDILKVANNTICIAKSCKDDLKKMLGYLKGSSYINATSGVQLTDEIIDKKIKEL